MDAFEDLVAALLRNEGYWVEPSFKVRLEKHEKVAIGRASSPRWEIDLVAYKPVDNELLVVECKSFLDSRGVSISSFAEGLKPDRYKLFNEPTLRKIVFERLSQQLIARSAILPNPRVQLCLAAGRIKSPKDSEALHALFSRRGWRLFDERWLADGITLLSKDSYQNSVASVVSKLMLRQRARASSASV